MSRQEPAGGGRPLTALLTGPARLVCEKVIDPMRRPARRFVARSAERLNASIAVDLRGALPAFTGAGFHLKR